MKNCVSTIKNTIPTLLFVGVAIFLAGIVIKVSGSESDTDALIRIKASQSKAPKIAYPTKDQRGRSIPKLDYLVVFPNCDSCSDFRVKARTYMAANPGKTYLILTPDLKGSEDILKEYQYYVYQFAPNSKYAEIPEGVYSI